MPSAYIIRSGCSFRLADGSLASGGATIELEDDVAQAHAEKLQPVVIPTEPQTEVPAEPAAEA